jgi:hypothetical protein
MKHVWQFNRWYDRQGHPGRLGMLLLAAAPICSAELWVSGVPSAIGLAVYTAMLLGPRVWFVHCVQ